MDLQRLVLSTEQQAAIEHRLGRPAMVDAGAGTGKTFTIVERVAALCNSGCVAPSDILLLTFGRKAAGELERRIVARLGQVVETPTVATFHAFALSILKQHGYELTISPDLTLINEIDARLEFASAFDEWLSGKLAADASCFCLRLGLRDDVREALFIIAQYLKDRGIEVEQFKATALHAADEFSRVPYRAIREERKKAPPKTTFQVDDAEFLEQMRDERARIESASVLFHRFSDRLSARGALTYADLLYVTERVLRQQPEIAQALRRRYKHCIVDEFQDTDPRQASLLQAIFGSYRPVMAVGDPRQSIYAFRGANPENAATFRASDDCVNYTLSENRRSRQEILDLAHSVIARHTQDPSALRAARRAAGTQVVHVNASWGTPRKLCPDAEESRRLEAAVVAGRISELLRSGRRVEQADGTRVRLQPQHIAVLSRNKTKIQPFTDALLELDIPYRLLGGVGFYDAPEVLDALSWMKLLADPFESIALARAAAGPGVDISDATLCQLNPAPASADHGDGHAAEIFARRLLIEPLPESINPGGRRRIVRLRDNLERLEDYSGAPVGLAYEAVLDVSGLADAAERGSGRSPAQTLANLRKLGGLARTFGVRNPGARPADFVAYIKALELSEEDDREADPPAGDAVDIMTIHAAKGLEWPIVFMVDVWPPKHNDKAPVRIAEDSGAFIVSEDAHGNRPFHTRTIEEGADAHGVALQRTDRPRADAREREERRLFYVGLTRARDELFLSGRRSHPGKDHPLGKPDPFLQEAISWMETRGWPVDEPLPPLPLTGDEAFSQAPPATAGSDSAPTDAAGETALSAQPNGAVTRAPRPAAKFRVPTLSFTLIARFERCARQVNYELALGLPPLAFGTSRQIEDDGVMPDVLPLSLGAYGRLVHRSLELWLRASVGTGLQALADPWPLVARAAADLREQLTGTDAARACAAVVIVAAGLRGWKPLYVEAPFVLDYGGVAASGYIDLIAMSPDAKLTVLDFKTGDRPVEDYALQFALYADGARRAYGARAESFFVGRVDDGTFALEAAAPLEAAHVETRVRAAAAGIESGDVTARPGEWCRACPYRAAPCMDYQRSGPDSREVSAG
ncbi:MAG: ATP-dependent helicase [Candidatus Eremiobacteraeota bacterium]|nr:ATP-dependent helicase [Candidatus Eremiobacteraeota bacterium]